MQTFSQLEQDKYSLFFLILTGLISSCVKAKSARMQMNKNSLSNIKRKTTMRHELMHLHETILLQAPVGWIFERKHNLSGF